MGWKQEYEEKLRTPEEAVKIVRDGDVVYIGTASSVACVLAEALYKRKDELENVPISSSINPWLLPFYTEPAGGTFSVRTYFAGQAEREAMKHSNCECTSLHLSQVDRWCRQTSGITVAFLDVSPPDKYGFMSDGAFGTAMHGFIKDKADRVVLQVNKNAPYVYGQQNLIHISEADYVVEAEMNLGEVQDMPVDGVVKTISEYIVDEIPDGATIQLGLGGVSGAVGFGLEKKCDLGVHSEMMTNSMMHLMKKGIVTNKKKTFLPGKTVAAFSYGSRELYDFVDRNPEVMFAPYTYVNDPYIIGQNDKMMSVNTAMSIDLFGQVAADSMAGRQVSAVGGQVDFVRGAQLSRGGKSMIALPSTMKKGDTVKSKIMAAFPPGTAVTTSRQDVHYVVTEYGCVNLKPLTIQERARTLISLAHPDFRKELEEEAKKIGIL
ncbi:MAG: acetyl-CoA hydrolase [Firmicutes bacterium]|nr:acetyl-CoA hydrolase [Bacillota bacterium]